ncbi:TOBE domain-containing protein [Roseateles cellulosilyticus]|uniref:TOBE domain-containing protein n=1 Tax=Pelomonas cellulosilytica TaxID=2906762 RepID=A0ABS8Y3F3_9BURK|nr:TOBE domain-containing protein [Pelomonas sp. P8]MCE4556530.1 TOBE domain-containing protein [Pelomonas sp. P8]
MPATSRPRLAKSAPSRFTGRIEVATDVGAFLGDTRVRLLEAIDSCGSISQAAKRVPLSYKAAWDAVDAMNNLADQPLVERSTGGKAGGGTRLTDHGRRVIAMFRAVEAEHQAALDRLSQRFADMPGGDATSFQRLLRRMSVRTSARNQFVGTVSGLREGRVDYEVRVRLDDALELVAVVTRESAETLGLAIGSEVVALVKASSLLLVTDPALRLSARNQLWGTVSRIVDGPVNAEVTVDLSGGRSAVAVLTRESVPALGLAEGVRACAAFKVSSVILAVID